MIDIPEIVFDKKNESKSEFGGGKMDIALHYQENGTGEPLILLHGNGEDGSYFQHQIDYFSGSYRVIAVDTRGHGKSPRGTKPFTIKQFSCDLHDFMERLDIANAVILGFSDGANIAMEFTLKYSGKVKALILNGGNLDPEGVKRTTQIPIEIGYKIANRFASKSPDAKRNAELLGLMVNEPHIKPGELSKITVPTLVICGKHDMIKESHSKEIAENIPNATLTIIKGDHFIASKEYAAFNRAVEEFLSTI